MSSRVPRYRTKVSFEATFKLGNVNPAASSPVDDQKNRGAPSPSAPWRPGPRGGQRQRCGLWALTVVVRTVGNCPPGRGQLGAPSGEERGKGSTLRPVGEKLVGPTSIAARLSPTMVRG